jgi:hypothetical protein
MSSLAYYVTSEQAEPAGGEGVAVLNPPILRAPGIEESLR